MLTVSLLLLSAINFLIYADEGIKKGWFNLIAGGGAMFGFIYRLLGGN